MLKGLSEGDKIEFKEILLLSEEQTGKRPSTYASQILDFDKDDDNVISVSMPVSKGHLVPLPKGSVFDTYFYTERDFTDVNAEYLTVSKQIIYIQ